MSPRVLLLDHRDSFVHLLADQLARAGADVDVVPADASLSSWRDCLERARPALVVLSPGPGHPVDAAVARGWLAARPPQPTLGVCLGHQVLALAAGASVRRGARPRHGESARLRWHEPFCGLQCEQHAPVARYHSLEVAAPPRGAPLRVLATTRDDDGRDVVMAIEHTELPQVGVQFHPESMLTPHGRPLLRAVLAWAERRRTRTETNEKNR